MKKYKIFLAVGLLAVSYPSLAQVINWTVSIQKIHVDNETVKVLVKDITNPNPGGSNWDCTSDLISLGGYTNPIPATLKYSTAMAAYNSGATARIGVEGSGANCLLTYITINDKP